MADQTLIKGAGMAAMSDSGINTKIARSKAVSKVGQQLTNAAVGYMNSMAIQKQQEKLEQEQVEKEKEAKGQQYDAFAQKVLNDSELPQAEWDALYDELQLGRDAYINGTPKEKAQAIRDLNMKAKD